MIGLVIFSKDRALQLEGLLSSLKTNCNIFDSIYIIWKATDDRYKAGYEKLISESHIRSTHFFKETSLKSDILFLMTSKYTCFMVDDLIAYRPLKNQTTVAEDTLMTKESKGIFSLRLGNNIRNCPRKDFAQNNDYECGFTFDWTQYKKYWAYPLSVDGHVYRTDYIKTIIKAINFDTPNKLEAHFQGYVPQAPKYMSCFNQSVVVSIPINRVSDTASAVYGEFYPHTAKELNDRFLAGERMDWQAMNFDNIISPHQEIELKFKTI